MGEKRSTDFDVGKSAAERVAFERIFNRAMMWIPDYRAPSAWTEHLPFAFWLMQAASPGSLVELGSHYGSSYFGFCQAIQRLGLAARCYAVDTWKGDEHAGFYGEDVFSQVSAHNAAFFSEFSSLVRTTFDDALDHFQDRSVDVLHVDGMHTEEAVRHDIDSWLPKLSSRGVILMHDTNVRERGFGVYKVFAELQGRYPSFEFLHGHGLGVVMVGPAQPDVLTRLASLDEDGIKVVREAFARLGRACAESVHGIEQAKRLQAHIQESDARGKRIADHQAEELRLRKKAQAAESERDAVEVRARRAENDAKARLERLALREQEIETLRAQVASRHLEAEDLRGQAATFSGKLEALAQERLQVEDDLEKVGKELEMTREQLDRALGVAQAAQAEVESLSGQKQVAEAAATNALDDGRKLREESKRLLASLVDRYTELAALTKRLEHAERALKDSQTLQREYEARAAVSEQGRDAVRAELDSLREDWSQVVGSRSWKLTRPLRGVRRLLAGKSAGHRPDPHEAMVSEIRASGRFNESWYLKRNPDVAASGWDAISHYVHFGANEGRDPSPDFNAAAYTARHPEAMSHSVNPLIHALRSGAL